MSPVIKSQNFIIHRLRPKLYGSDIVAFEQHKNFLVDTVGTSRNSYTAKALFPRVFFCRSKQPRHIIPVNGCKAAAEEGYFRLGAFLGVGNMLISPLDYLLRFIRRGRMSGVAYSPLIAEGAGMGTAHMRDKNRNICVSHIRPRSP